MRDENVSTHLALCCALLPTVLLPALYPQVHLFFFSPFLVLLIYRRPLVYCLYAALGIGLLLDLLSAHQRLGLHALALCATTSILFRSRSRFFPDKSTTLPIMTSLYSALSTALLFILLRVFDHHLVLTWEWVATDLLLWPVFDALYALVWWYGVRGLARMYAGTVHH